jgi:hypothetical protein
MNLTSEKEKPSNRQPLKPQTSTDLATRAHTDRARAAQMQASNGPRNGPADRDKRNTKANREERSGRRSGKERIGTGAQIRLRRLGFGPGTLTSSKARRAPRCTGGPVRQASASRAVGGREPDRRGGAHGEGGVVAAAAAEREGERARKSNNAEKGKEGHLWEGWWDVGRGGVTSRWI